MLSDKEQRVLNRALSARQSAIEDWPQQLHPVHEHFEPSGGGTIWISARIDQTSANLITVTVADDGNGFGSGTSGTGIGLKNVRERLKLAYGGDATFSIVANFPHGVAASITVPVTGPKSAS